MTNEHIDLQSYSARGQQHLTMCLSSATPCQFNPVHCRVCYAARMVATTPLMQKDSACASACVADHKRASIVFVNASKLCSLFDMDVPACTMFFLVLQQLVRGWRRQCLTNATADRMLPLQCLELACKAAAHCIHVAVHDMLVRGG